MIGYITQMVWRGCRIKYHVKVPYVRLTSSVHEQNSLHMSVPCDEATGVFEENWLERYETNAAI